MELSSTTGYLSGKLIPGTLSPVSAVYKHEKKRVIVHKDGTTTELSKRRLKNVFNQVLSANQHQEMSTTLRKHQDGHASVVLGGHQKGERKHYVSPTGAKNALKRYYGKKAN